MTSTGWFILLVAAVGVERIVELIVSQRNIRWALERGGVEFGRGHYPAMVALHVALLGGSVLEVVLLDRPFLPWMGLPMLGLALGAQSLRYWAVTSLGRRWNVRVITIPGMPLETSGPYRFLRHPNYLAVALEGIAIPLIHTAYLTAIGFTLLNGLMLHTRIRCEERALGYR